MSKENIDPPIYVTRPALPNLDDLIPYLEEMWSSRMLSNSGPFHQRLESELSKFLEVPYVSLFGNGTLALIAALQASGASGDVITTPFTFVATPHSLRMLGLNPIFVDVDPLYGNLDPNNIEKALTSETTAVLPVHVYGNPCDVGAIEEICKRNDLHLIYDAAHAFGVKHKETNILNYGDYSILSFHATKVFNTFEGGAVICKTEASKKRIDKLKNFGIDDEVSVSEIAPNSKMNELQSAVGLTQLPHIEKFIFSRKKVAMKYAEGLSKIRGINPIPIHPDSTPNFAYFPILVDSNKYSLSRDDLYFKLQKEGIYGRRYFYPLVSDFKPYKHLPSSNKDNLPIASILSEQVICLPIYPDLSDFHVDKIINIISNE